jgi:16S rRNA (uracil1498-N3)-methyltransferase
VLHEEATVALSAVDLPATGEIALVVGPEGGVAAEELAAFAAAGAVAVRLGPTVLRTSTAGAAALAVLSARLHRW